MANVTKVDDSFEDLTGHQINSLSYIRLFNILKDNEVKKNFLNIFRTYVVDKNNLNKIMKNITYEISHDDWWENISYAMYKTVNLWWLNPLMNDIQNPFEDVEPGDNIITMKEEFIRVVMNDLERLSLL